MKQAAALNVTEKMSYKFIRSSRGGVTIASALRLSRDKPRNDSAVEMLISSFSEPKHVSITMVCVMEAMPFLKGYDTLKYRVFLKYTKLL
jgi:hypothetical protein